MKITAHSIYVGPNIYAQRPVVHYVLEGLEQRPMAPTDRGLLADLFRRLPGLRTHSGMCGAPNCFEAARAGEVLPISHLFEHVCIVLQNLVGAELACVRTSAADRIGPGSAAVPYEEAEVCIASARLASDLIAGLVSTEPRTTDADPPGFDFMGSLEKFIAFAAGTMLPVQDRALVRTARGLGIPAVRVVGRMVVLGHGRFQQRVSGTKTSFTNVLANDLAANKDYTRRVLSEFGLPVPHYERVHRRRQAVEAASRIGYPVVVKPNDGSMGHGVSVRMKNRREVSDAYKRARVVSRSVLVEEVVDGDDYRMVVINGKFCAAARRIPARVVGDGTHTIEELVGEVNRDPRRAPGHTSSWTRIQLDEQSDRLISVLGYTRLSIPRDGEVVYLRRIANSSAGGTAVDVTDEVHPDNRDIAVRAVQAIGLDIAGVDVLTKDISSSLWQNGGKIGEINSKPGLRKHLWPAEGKPRDVITPILDMLFPAGRPSRVPIVVIVGTGNTQIVAQMLAHILTAAGHHVGLATEHRVYSGGREPRNVQFTPPAAARRILLDPDVDVAVLEISPADVLRYGLGCDSVDVVAIVNAGSGALDGNSNQRVPAEYLDAIRVVARAARDVVYVGESGELAVGVESACAEAEFCCVCLGVDGRRVADRAPAGGRRVVLQGDSISIRNRGRLQVQMPLAKLRRRFPGLDPDLIVQSALYASVAAYSLGNKPEDIYRSLSRFRQAPGPSAPKRKRKRQRKRAAKAQI